jgi:hypothetical protein
MEYSQYQKKDEGEKFRDLMAGLFILLSIIFFILWGYYVWKFGVVR